MLETAFHLLRRQLRVGIVAQGRRALTRWRVDGLRGVGASLRAKLDEAVDERRYSDWIRRYDTLDDDDRRLIRQRIEQLSNRPVISVVMPVFDPDESWLRAAIESVLAQIYPHWQLCIADDHSTRTHVAATLGHYESIDERIQVIYRDTTGHIAAASNSALELATGAYIALLDHDDILPAHALYMVAEEINQHPDAAIIYSDEDKIDTHNRRYGHYFKPDFDPDLFLCQNFISHLGVYRRDIVTAIGGFRAGFEGSQDYDLALRVWQQASEKQIRHIPHVLYHWRATAGSAALREANKEYAFLAARRAVTAYLSSHSGGLSVQEHPRLPTCQTILYTPPDPAPRVSIMVATRDRLDLLKRCLESIRRLTRYDDFEIIVVDNRSCNPSTRDYLSSLSRESDTRVIEFDAPFNFSALHNTAARQATGSVLAFLNNDTEVISEDWLQIMVGLLMRRGVGAVGAKLLYPKGTVQHAGIVLGLGGVAGHVHRGLPAQHPGYWGRALLTQRFSAITGACMLIKRSAFDAVGGFDESLAVAYNDVDLCLRLGAQGLCTVWTPHAELYHHESASRASDEVDLRHPRFVAEKGFFAERWRHQIARDPHYNANLSLTSPRVKLAHPPRARRPWLSDDPAAG